MALSEGSVDAVAAVAYHVERRTPVTICLTNRITADVYMFNFVAAASDVIFISADTTNVHMNMDPARPRLPCN